MLQEKSFLKLILLFFLFTFLTVLNAPTAVTAAQLTLSWSDNSTNEDGFRVERRTGTAGTYAEIKAVGVNVKSYTDVNLANGTIYCYRVRAYNSGGASGYSNEKCATTPVATSYVLTVAKSGNGGGIVTATGINCGSDCSEPYDSGSSVALTAMPSSGSSFAGWSGTGCTTGPVTINGNMTCTATFNLVPAQSKATLTVTKVGSGIVSSAPSGIYCGNTCSYSFTMGGTVTLQATPSAGFTFAGWSDSGCQDTSGCTVTISSNTAVTATFVSNNADKIGIYRPSTGQWVLDKNGIGIWDDCRSNKCVQSAAGAVPVVGEWNSSGVTLLGLLLPPATAQRSLYINGNEALEYCGVDICLGPFGQGTDIPVSGKWSSTGYDRIGVFRPSNERWYLDVNLDVNGNGSLDRCSKDRCASLSVYRDGDLPVTGDWNGDGVTQVGLYRPSTGQWFLDRNGDRSWDGCRRDLCISSFGAEGTDLVPLDGDLPVTGDWSGTGPSKVSKVGIFRPNTYDPATDRWRSEWFLDLNGNNKWDGCGIDLCVTDFGDVGDIPVAGKW
jgi:Divergent InlB B-repeat domain